MGSSRCPSWAARLTVFLAMLALYPQMTYADFMNIKFSDYMAFTGWNTGDVRTIPSSIPPLPEGANFLRVYHPTLTTYWSSGFQITLQKNLKMSNITDSRYGTFNFYIYPVTGDVGQCQFQLMQSGTLIFAVNLYTFTTPYANNHNITANTIPMNQWSKVSVDIGPGGMLAQNTGGPADGLTIMNPTGGDMQVYMAMWLGDLADYIPPGPPPPAYIQPAFVGPKGETSISQINATAYTFLTDGQTNNLYKYGDQGITPEWDCSGTMWRGYEDLTDISIWAYRDTTLGPLPMNLAANAVYDDDALVTYKHMYDQLIIRDAWQAPNPLLGCVIHNADYIEIGDTKTATQTLQVWANGITSNTNYFIGGYAQWIKAKREEGVDVAVVVRTRLPNGWSKYRPSHDFDASMDMKVNCSDAAPDWQCPDHWWFSDTQLGVMKQQKDALIPLTNFSLNYFADTGFDTAVDMMGSALTLVTFDGKQYALPAYVMGYPWRARERIFNGYQLNDLTFIPPIPFKRPPPLDDWGAAWWLDWNITTFLNMLDYMYEERNMTNIFTIPADFTETAFYSYLGIGFGATIFDAQGHCGMGKKSEKVLNQTFMNWISKPGLLGERYIPDQDIFNAWLAAPINWDRPQDEPTFGWYHPSWKPGNTWEAQAFDTGYCYTADCKNIYPPTGMSMISAGLVGLPKTSRNPDLAYEALMYAIVRNEAVQANVPIQTTSTGGVSPWLSSQSLPEYKQADRAWWASLVAHGVFAGYPSPQTYGFFETSYYDPLKLVTAEILFKNLSVSDAVKRACKLINYATREPCTSAQWEVKLINDPANNHDTVNYSWPIGIEDVCRVDLAVTQQPLPALKNYLASTTISTSSNNGKGIIALCVFGIVLELALIASFIIYRNAPVIKAASFVPSLMIMFGAILALISVMTRISTSSTPHWLQCFGTYWFFALGFSSLLGSLAMKTYRVDQIFHSAAQGKSASMSGFRLNMHILGLNLVNVVLLLFYQFCIIDDSRIKETPMPNSSILLNQPDCPVIHPAASILLYAYNAAIVLLAGVFAYRTRNFISSFNENHFTVAAITLISVVSIIIVPVIQFINSAEATFMLIALGTFLASILSTLVFAVPKLLIAMGRMQGEDIGSALKNNVNKSSVKMMSSVNTKSILISKTQSVGGSEQSASFNGGTNTLELEREGKSSNGKGHGSVVRSHV